MEIKFADGSREKYEDDPLAAGAEGEVYRSRDGISVVKLYFPDPQKDSARISRIDILINELNPTRGNRYWTEFFTWPEKRAVQPGIGYRMRFAGDLKTLEHYILGKAFQRLKPEERGWFIGRIGVALKLAMAANRLSSMGLCYPDFSGKNILVDAFRAQMVLIDCDSMTVPDKLPPTVEGTSYFRAPEIVIGDAATPSVTSDRHTLAVIFYYWLLYWHPLNGDNSFDPDDPDHDDSLRYGQNALYIEHPKDASNRASKQVLKAHMLGPELEGLFKQAFVDGLHNPGKRPLPFQWQRAFYHTYDHLVPCTSPYCDWRFFVVAHSPQLFTGRPLSLTCPRCGTALKEPKTLPFIYLLPHRGTNVPDDYANISAPDNHYVVGWPKRQLHLWHTKRDATRMYTDVSYVADANSCAAFAYDEQMDQWEMHNLRLPDMSFTEDGQTWTSCPLKRSIRLIPGMTIQFGPAPEYFRARVFLEKVI